MLAADSAWPCCQPPALAHPSQGRFGVEIFRFPRQTLRLVLFVHSLRSVRLCPWKRLGTTRSHRAPKPPLEAPAGLVSPGSLLTPRWVSSSSRRNHEPCSIQPSSKIAIMQTGGLPDLEAQSTNNACKETHILYSPEGTRTIGPVSARQHSAFCPLIQYQLTGKLLLRYQTHQLYFEPHLTADLVLPSFHYHTAWEHSSVALFVKRSLLTTIVLI